MSQKFKGETKGEIKASIIERGVNSLLANLKHLKSASDADEIALLNEACLTRLVKDIPRKTFSNHNERKAIIGAVKPRYVKTHIVKLLEVITFE